MDATTKKLVRRARLRRHHDRHVRAARMRKKAEDRRKSARPSYEKSPSTVPSLPSLQGSQYLTGKKIKDANDSEQKNSLRLPQRFQSDDYVSDSCVPLLKEVYSSDVEDRGHYSDTALTVVKHSQTNTGVVNQRHVKKKPRRAPPIPEEPPLLLTSPVPPSPSLSLIVKEKTESLKLSDKLFSDIKQMSSHLRIVNWLCDAHRIETVGGGGGRTNWKSSPISSGNLVIVRRNSHNWFDMPQVHPREQMSPISVNSDLKSDFEEELLRLV